MTIHSQYNRIYKYTTIEAAIQILSNLTIRFKNPFEYNDPFECNTSFIYYDFLNTDDITRSELRIMHEQFPELYDNPDLISKWYSKSVLSKIAKIGVSCFSLNGNNQLMWAHYASSYKGVCIEFSNLNSSFEDMKKHTEGTVFYGDRNPFNYLGNKLEAIKLIFMTKSNDWKYEEEYRIITLNGPDDYIFHKSFLVSLTFGLRVEESEINLLKNIATEKGLDIVFQKSIQNGLKIEYEKI